jgi:hypothetical protein
MRANFVRLIAMLSTVVTLSLGSARASQPTPTPAPVEFSGAARGAVDISLRFDEANEMVNRMLNEGGFWADAKVSDYTKKDRQYDEIRLKPVTGGYIPMITGESDEDIPHEVVADIVFEKMTLLPKYMDGALAVTELGAGTDPKNGLPYVDTYYVLDLSLLYVAYPQRMYREKSGDRTLLYFEKVDASFVDVPTWTAYEDKIKATMDGLDLRSWFGSVIDPQQIYGIFIVSPGAAHESRVTFVTKLVFGEDAGWVAKLGNKMPPVLRSGVQSGFNASVAIAKYERDKRTK